MIELGFALCAIMFIVGVIGMVKQVNEELDLNKWTPPKIDAKPAPIREHQDQHETICPPQASNQRLVITDEMRARSQREIMALISDSKPLAEKRIQRIRDIATSKIGKYCQIGITQGNFIQCYICSVSSISIKVRNDDHYPSEIFLDTIVSIG
jgi:hypothetical protein